MKIKYIYEKNSVFKTNMTAKKLLEINEWVTLALSSKGYNLYNTMYQLKANKEHDIGQHYHVLVTAKADLMTLTNSTWLPFCK